MAAVGSLTAQRVDRRQSRGPQRVARWLQGAAVAAGVGAPVV